MDLAIYFAIGLAAGWSSGMFGIGGGSVRIPLLNVVGLSLVSAYGINLLVIPFSSIVGAITQRKNIDYRIGFLMILSGGGGSILGAYFVGAISNLILAILFVIITLLTVLGIYLGKMAPALAKKLKPTPGVILGGTFILNFITGMRGGSGGSLFPPFLKSLNLSIRTAIATSLFVTIFSATAGCVIYWGRGDILWGPGAAVILGSVIGARLGSRLSLKTKPRRLSFWLSVIVVLLALLVIYKAV